jgi:hypothetical protein
VTAPFAILAVLIALLEILPVPTAPLASSERPTAASLIFDELTAFLWIFFDRTAPFFSCLGPTLRFGSAATASPTPVRTMKTAIVAITLAYVSCERRRFSTRYLPFGSLVP